MKALVLKANAELTIEETAAPLPGPAECLLRVQRAGVCSSDIPRAFARGAYQYPLIMGHELSGVVEACGADVTRAQPGDRVAVYPLLPCRTCESCRKGATNLCSEYGYYGSRRNGGFATHLAVHEWNLIKLPPIVDDVVGAVLEPMAVAWHALTLLKPSAEDRVIVIGAGFIGLALVQLCLRRYRCREVWVADRHRAKLRLAESWGARTELLDSPLSTAALASQAGRFDAVAEAVGSPDTYRMSLTLAARGGRVAWVGNISGDLLVEKSLVSQVLRKELSTHGVWNSGFDPDTAGTDWAQVLEAVQHKVLDPKPMISHEAPLEEGPQLLARMQESKAGRNPGAFQKVILCP